LKTTSNVILAMNETSRLCVHEISGHVHLIRFCLEELMENPELKQNNFFQKLVEGVSSLEESNDVCKSTLLNYIQYDSEELEVLVEKAQNLCMLYTRKLIPDTVFKVEVVGACSRDKAIILTEGLFAIYHAFVHLAFEQGLKSLTITTSQESVDLLKFKVSCLELKVDTDRLHAILSYASDQDRSYRRFMGADLLKEKGVLEIVPDGDVTTVMVGV
jgi:hypothetical protein